jgi:NAD(P) transhydrogenase subunit alpha
VLVTADMVAAMKPGSVVVDLAAESGGNCELSVAGEDVVHADGLVVGLRDVPSSMAVDASRLYARNLTNLLLLMTKDGVVQPDFDDEIVAGCAVTHQGRIVHEPTRLALVGDAP